MTDKIRALTSEALRQVAGGFEAIEHSQFTSSGHVESQTLGCMSQQMSNVLATLGSRIQCRAAR